MFLCRGNLFPGAFNCFDIVNFLFARDLIVSISWEWIREAFKCFNVVNFLFARYLNVSISWEWIRTRFKRFDIVGMDSREI